MTPQTTDEPAFEDLTARARIREAAIRLFAEHGAEETAILDIAKQAGVSGGLIRHHFGSKDGLRVACDTYVLRDLTRFKLEAINGFARPIKPDVSISNMLVSRVPSAVVSKRKVWLKGRDFERLL